MNDKELPGTVSSILHVLSHLILKTVLRQFKELATLKQGTVGESLNFQV